MEVVEAQVEEVVAVVDNKMKQKMNCPLCKEELFSGIGFGCLMCGMPIENKKDRFCSEGCEKKYGKIGVKRNE